MASGVNKVILIGNLGADPEVRSFPDGGTVANISIATSDVWTDRATGQRQERTEWHRVVLRDRGNYRLGQIAAQYLRKGSKVFIDGRLQTRKWQDSQGVDRYTTEIVANEMQMLDSRAGSEGATNTNDYSAQHYGQAASPQHAAAPQQAAPMQQQQVQPQAYQQPAAPAQPAQQATYQQPAAAPVAQQPQAQPQQAPTQQQPAASPPPSFSNFDDDIPF